VHGEARGFVQHHEMCVGKQDVGLGHVRRALGKLGCSLAAGGGANVARAGAKTVDRMAGFAKRCCRKRIDRAAG
jgi:hypothetical protein